MKYIPYTYLIGWSKQNKWYYGVRYAKKSSCLYETGCHPDELWKTYFTTSKEVMSFRKIHGEPNVIQIRKTFENHNDARLWETKVLKRLNVIHKNYFLNKTNNISIFNDQQVLKENATKISKALKGRILTQEHKNKISQNKIGTIAWNKGKILGPVSVESKNKRSKSMKEKIWITNGKHNKRINSNDDIPKNWSLGRVYSLSDSKNSYDRINKMAKANKNMVSAYDLYENKYIKIHKDIFRASDRYCGVTSSKIPKN